MSTWSNDTRKTAQVNHPVLPKRLKWLAYYELHERMGYLRGNRVYQLGKDDSNGRGWNKIPEITSTTNVYALHKRSHLHLELFYPYNQCRLLIQIFLKLPNVLEDINILTCYTQFYVERGKSSKTTI